MNAIVPIERIFANISAKFAFFFSKKNIVPFVKNCYHFSLMKSEVLAETLGFLKKAFGFVYIHFFNHINVLF